LSGAGTGLGLAALPGLPAGAAPRHDPTQARVGIVHLGLGNFHRAHQAVYADDALAAGERDWAICAINLRSRGLVDAMAAQDGLYTLLVRGAVPGQRAADGASGTQARVIGSIRELMSSAASGSAAVGRIADPAIRIVTLTVTEKAYVDEDDGAIGFLVDALAARVAAGAGPLTLLSCDNLSMNGDTLRGVLAQCARRRSLAEVQAFLETRVECPNTMVDRIVPATVDADRDEALSLTGWHDACPVATEPFSQWVIEDRFAAGRPDWARDGVQFVSGVVSWEAMKLGLLNAAHSALAYLGLARGKSTVDEAVADPAMRAFVERMWRDELVPALPREVVGAAPAYCASLLERFANPALGHRLQQISMDGSKKIPQRWLPAVRASLARTGPPDALCCAIAAWIIFLQGPPGADLPWRVDDPLGAELQMRARSGVDSVLAFEPVFGDLAGHRLLGEGVRAWHRRLTAPAGGDPLR
jgi:fructuronate reductase